MKRILSLLIILVLLITVIGSVPTVFAEERSYNEISKEMCDKYWPSMCSSGIVKIGDWYYGLNSYTNEKYINSVCGYDGDETEITIPTEIDGYKIDTMKGFYLLSDTVETIKIPKEIDHIYTGYVRDFTMDSRVVHRYILYNKTTKLKEIIVDRESESFSSQDGVLFSKLGLRLYFYPPQKTDKEYTVPSLVDGIYDGAICYQPHLKSLTIPQSVQYVFEDSITDSLEELYFDNTHDIVGKTILQQYGYDPDEMFFECPKVPNGSIYCLYGTPMHEYYEENRNNKTYNGDPFFKELKLVPRKYGEWLIKENGVWYYCNNGEKAKKTTLMQYKDTWFYITDGIWDKTVTNKIITYKEKEFYIKNGKWDNNLNTLAKLDNKWRYIKDGKPCFNEDFVKYKEKWFYTKNGLWDKTVNTLFKKNGKWFAIKSGKWYKDKAIIKYEGKKFYVNKGFVQFKYSGNVKINGKTYKIKNGKVA